MKNDSINNAYKISLNLNGKYIYSLYIKFIPDLQAGYETPEDAKAAAEVALEDDPTNKSYTITQGADGRYYYLLSPNPAETPETPAEPEKPGKTDVTPTPSVPENHYYENDYANIGAGEGTKEDGKKENSKEESKENGKKEDSKEESKENGKKEDSKEESKENGKKEKPGKEEKPAKEEKENTDSPNKKKKEKAALPKAGSEAEILTLAAAALSTAAGAFVSLKKRK